MVLPGGHRQEAFPSRQVRLVAFDLDGTVLDDYGIPDPDAMGTVRELLDRGIYVAAISGRSIRRCLQGLSGYAEIAAAIHICGYNGAAAVGPRQNEARELLFTTRLEHAVLEELTEYAAGNGLNLVYCRCEDGPAGLQEEYRFLRETGNSLSTVDWNGAGYVLDPDLITRLRRREFGPPPKLMMFTASGAQNSTLADLSARFAGRIYVAWAIPELLEIMAPDVNKGTALEQLARQLGIDVAQTLAIGDGNNDLPMLRRAGIGLLMGGAPDSVRRSLADSRVREVRPFAQGGFAHAMYEHALGGQRSGTSGTLDVTGPARPR